MQILLENLDHKGKIPLTFGTVILEKTPYNRHFEGI